MTMAPVFDLDTRRRALIAKRLLHLGVPVHRITATRTDQELAALWTRERTVASLIRLTGHQRALFDLWPTEDLIELERITLRHLMSSAPGHDGRLIYSIGGYTSRNKHRGQRMRADQRTKERAWGIDPEAA
jgi:hypothetical protein